MSKEYKNITNDKGSIMNYFTKTAMSLVLSMVATLAIAGEMLPYDQATFDKLASDGKSVVVEVKADWCTTCKAQKPILSVLMNTKEYKNVSMLIIDFDAQKPLVQKFNVSMQSTLIAFKGGKEVDRTVGDTSHNGIEGLIKKSL